MVNPSTHSLPNPNVLEQAVIDEIERARDAGDLDRDPSVEPRCHVCCEVESRELVNKLITAGMTNREIADTCRGINNQRRAKDDDRLIEARNVWSHRKNHYDTDRAAREIIERRAKERGIDFINGIGHAITPYAVYETTMVKGYEKNLASPDAEGPTLKETMDAALKLHDLTARDAGTQRMADLMHTMDRIILAAEKFIPEEYKEAFVAEVEGKPLSKPIQVLTERVAEKAEKVIKDFSPPRIMDENDEI